MPQLIVSDQGFFTLVDKNGDENSYQKGSVRTVVNGIKVGLDELGSEGLSIVLPVPFDEWTDEFGVPFPDLQTLLDTIQDNLFKADFSDLTAANVGYDNTNSGLAATNVQDAIDEVVSKIELDQVKQRFFSANDSVGGIVLTVDGQEAIVPIGNDVRFTDPIFTVINNEEIEVNLEQTFFISAGISGESIGNNRVNAFCDVEISVDSGANWTKLPLARKAGYIRNVANNELGVVTPVIPVAVQPGYRFRLIFGVDNVDSGTSLQSLGGQCGITIMENVTELATLAPPDIIEATAPPNPLDIDQYDNYNQTIVATGNQKIWSLMNQPPEMTINPITGNLDYTALTTFNGLVDIIVSNPAGSDTYQFQLNVIQNPAQRPTLQYFFEADRLIGFSNNDKVPVLEDFSGNAGSEPSQANPGFQGVYKVLALGPGQTLPVINFPPAFYTGVFDQIRSDEAFTIFVYARVANESVTGTIVNFFSASLNIHEINYQATDDVRWRINDTAGLTHSNENTGDYRCLVFRYDPSGSGSGNTAKRQIYINAANNRVASSNGPAVLPDSQNYSIGSVQGVSSLLSGDIAHISMYDEAIPVNELQGIIQVIRQKWDT